MSVLLTELVSFFKQKKVIVIYAFLCAQITAFIFPSEVTEFAKEYIPSQIYNLAPLLLKFFYVCLVVYTVQLVLRVLFCKHMNDALVLCQQGGRSSMWLIFTIYVCTSLQVSSLNPIELFEECIVTPSFVCIVVCVFLPSIAFWFRDAIDNRKRQQ